MHSVVETNQDIILADLTTKPLRKLGIHPADIVTSEKDGYPFSRAVAEKMYECNPDIQGLRWMSRQDNTAGVYIFFENRFSSPPLVVIAPTRRLEVEAYSEVLDLADALDVQIVAGKVI